jgi:hypothetical protein
MDTIAYASSFVSSLSLGLAIIIGIAASILVFRAAHKMGGGLFGSVLGYMGAGMIIVVVGTLSVVFSAWLPSAWVTLIHTVLFSIGYICMVLGANKLYRGIMS